MMDTIGQSESVPTPIGEGDDQALLNDLWQSVFEDVRREVEIPTVWLAMQEAKPLAIHDNKFVVGLPKGSFYLSINLQVTQTRIAIEEAIERAAGYPLELHVVEGATVTDWESERNRHATVTARSVQTIPKSALGRGSLGVVEPVSASPSPSPVFKPVVQEPTREVMPNWDKLNERINHGYKTALNIKYPHGQARYILECVQAISDTMELFLSPDGKPTDPAFDRQLARTIERMGQMINLDPLFISLELLRYRAANGKDVGLT